MINVFGIYKATDDLYCFFITDNERGIPEYSMLFDKEEDACDALIKKMKRLQRIHESKRIS